MSNNVQRRFQKTVWMVGGTLCLLLSAGNSNRASAAAPEDAQKLAAQLVKKAGIQRGLCAVLGADGDLAVEVARASRLLTYARDPRSSAVDALRKRADEAGFDLDRMVVEQGSLSTLPFHENTLDVILSTQTATEKLSLKEILRALRPEGTAIIGTAGKKGTDADLKGLEKWALAGDVKRVKSWTDATGTWVQLFKPELEGAGDWSHWEHGPDNNPVSEDTVIKFPYMTQFLAKPYYIAMPSVTTAAGGRTFLAIGHIAHHRREWENMNRLIARNGYNGTVLWERKLPDGYMVHRSAFIATNDTFYMLDGPRTLLIDPQTGAGKGEVRLPGIDGDWKWMVKQDDVLYVLAGKKGKGAITIKGDRSFGGWSWADLSKGYYQKPHVPWGFGDTLAAYDLKKQKLLWKHSETKSPIDSRALSLGEGKLFLHCPKQHLRALDANTGEVLWTSTDQETLTLIEEEGKGLTSTPGFRSMCQAVFTPDALIIQGQTRQNVVAVSTKDGYLLWTKKKVTNNPNAIFVDGKVILGVGPGGSHVAVEPISGEVLEDLKFRKRACTRLTGCSDSFFVRGEGTLRYDRKLKKVLVDGAVRPACNDGALPANGLLYLGPWQCDCNLSLIGRVAKCSAGDFKFDVEPTAADRLQTGSGNLNEIAALATAPADWPTFRSTNARSSGTSANVAVGGQAGKRWQFSPKRQVLLTAPTSAGGLVFVGGEDGKVRALDGKNGRQRWEFATAGPIKYPPTISENRAYFGSGDGYAYCVKAASGRLLWRFRAAPVERHINIYGFVSSTWPVHSGVLVHDGVAYFAAGVIDYDGTYVYALDAKTGAIKWHNNSSGHLNEELRKGVSAQGNLTIQGNRLLLAGGNQVSPAAFDLETGKCLATPRKTGNPQANNGRFVGVFGKDRVIAGGRILYAAAENVSTKGNFGVVTKGRRQTLSFGGVPPAWDDNTFAMVNFKHGKVTCCDAEKVEARIAKGYAKPGDNRPDRRRVNLAAAFAADGAVQWQSDLGESNKFEAVSLAVAPNAVVSVVRYQQKYRAQPQWYVVAFNRQNGKPLWRFELRQEPLPDGLLIDAQGKAVVTLLEGGVIAVGPNRG